MKNRLFLLVSIALMADSAFAVGPFEVGPAALTISGRLGTGIATRSEIWDAASISQGTMIETDGNYWGGSFISFDVVVPVDDDLSGVAKLQPEFHLNKTKGLGDATSNAYVGLKSKRWGQFTIGRHQWGVDAWFLDPMGMQELGIDSLSGGRNWDKMNNVVKYQMPTLAGFDVGLQHKFGQNASSERINSGSLISLSYTHGPFNIRFIADQLANGEGKYSSSTGSWGTALDPTGRAENNKGLSDTGDWLNSKEFIVGATYQLSDVKFFIGYNRITARDAANNSNNPFKIDTVANHWWLGTNYNITPNLLFRFGYYHLDRPDSGKKSNLFATGLDYNINKYLMLYLGAGWVTNNSTGTPNPNLHSYNYWTTVTKDGGSASEIYGGIEIFF